MSRSNELLEILRDVKRLARRYYDLTGRPLGITGEIAELEAIEALDLEPAPVRQPGYDATRWTTDGVQHLQIKGRLVLPSSKPGQRMGAIDLTKSWDVVLLVLLNENFDPTAIYEADRSAVAAAPRGRKPETSGVNSPSASSSRSVTWFGHAGRKADTDQLRPRSRL